MPFWPICCESDAILFKKFRPGDRAGVFIWENFHPGYRDIGRKNRDLGNRASPASHMNTSIFLQRKEWQGEISETEPAALTGLICTDRSIVLTYFVERSGACLHFPWEKCEKPKNHILLQTRSRMAAVS